MHLLKEKPTHFLGKPSKLQFRNTHTSTHTHYAFTSLGIHTLKYNSVLKGSIEVADTARVDWIFYLEWF